MPTLDERIKRLERTSNVDYQYAFNLIIICGPEVSDDEMQVRQLKNPERRYVRMEQFVDELV